MARPTIWAACRIVPCPSGALAFRKRTRRCPILPLPSASTGADVVALRLLSWGVPRGRPYPIAFLLTSFDVGGTERQMVELIRRLDRSEFDVHVACFHRRGALESQDRRTRRLDRHVPDRRVRPSRRRSGNGSAFARWCRHINARVVHTCELYANIFGLPAAALAGVDVRVGNRRELVTPDKTRGQLAVPAAGVPSGPCRRRQLGGGRRAAPPRRRCRRRRFAPSRTASTARRSPRRDCQTGRFGAS